MFGALVLMIVLAPVAGCGVRLYRGDGPGQQDGRLPAPRVDR